MIVAAFNFVSTQPRGMCLAFLLLVYFAAVGMPRAVETLGPRAGASHACGATASSPARDRAAKKAQPIFSRVCGSSGVTVVHSSAGGVRGGAAGFAPDFGNTTNENQRPVETSIRAAAMAVSAAHREVRA